MKRAYYNDSDPDAAAWLQELMRRGEIAAGVVDPRPIQDVTQRDLHDFTQCHFFAGIGGWSLALRLAGWPDERPVWTGSCPCQPFSTAGRRRADQDDRHLWPEFSRLISVCRPPVLFGEQVASPDGLRWLDGVCADLEAAGYACAAADLCAAGLDAPHRRQRLYWVAHAGGGRRLQRPLPPRSRCQGTGAADQPGSAERLADAGREFPAGTRYRAGLEAAQWSKPGLDADARRVLCARGAQSKRDGPWSDFRVLACRDGNLRRVGAEPGDGPLAHGIPTRLGPLLARLEGLGPRAIQAARHNRVARLRGYGNAIVPQVAAAFIQESAGAIRS